jgi:hypothetical protein
MILLEIDTESISGIEFEGDTPRTIDMDRVAGWNKTSQGMKIKPGRFICSGAVATFKRSRRIKMRLCSAALIFAVRPFDHRSESALLRKVLITIKCKRLADKCQLIADGAKGKFYLDCFDR